MNNPTGQELKEFSSALQLCIKTKVNAVTGGDGEVIITFDSQPKLDDLQLHKFLKLFDCHWKEDLKTVVVKNENEINWPQLTLFLFLTRMDEGNISKLAEIDESAGEIAGKLRLKPHDATIESVKMCSKVIFDNMKDKKMTIRELAERTGLTQVSISNFKAGKDIRLSNLMKIVRALRMHVRMQ